MTLAMDQAGFTQAGIEVQNREAYQELHSRIERALGPAAERFFRSLSARKLLVREFEAMLAQGLFRNAGGETAGAHDQELYRSLTVSDQGLMREYFLTAIEQVPEELRRKFHALYRY